MRVRAIAFVAAATLAASALIAAPPFGEAPGAAGKPVARQAVGAATRFEYVAVFAAGTAASAIERWRQQVLATTFVQPCVGQRPCLGRALRLSSLGPSHGEVLAFDLAADTPAAERTALLAAAAQAQPRADLHHDSTPRQAVGG